MVRFPVPLLVLSCAAAPIAAQRPPWRQSVRDLEAWAQRDSLDPDALYWLARAYARTKHYDDAGRTLRRAIAINPRYTPAYVALAFMPFQRRSSLARDVRRGRVPEEWRDSLVESERLRHLAFSIDPLAELTPPDIAPQLVGIASWEVQFALARQYAGRPLDSIPPGALWLRGFLAGRGGDYQPAIRDFRELLRRAERLEQDSIVPFNVGATDIRYLLGVLSERDGRGDDAIMYYQATLASDLGHFMAHVRLARVYLDRRQWDEAVMEAQRAAATNPDDATTLRELGQVLLAAGRFTDAETALRQAIERNPRDVGTQYVLGVVLQQSGRAAEAIATLERFVASAPPALYEPQLADARRRLTLLRERP